MKLSQAEPEPNPPNNSRDARARHQQQRAWVAMHLAPVSMHSLNCAVLDHRRLADAMQQISTLIQSDGYYGAACTVWLPVLNAEGALSALYAAASSPPLRAELWGLWTKKRWSRRWL